MFANRRYPEVYKEYVNKTNEEHKAGDGGLCNHEVQFLMLISEIRALADEVYGLMGMLKENLKK